MFLLSSFPPKDGRSSTALINKGTRVQIFYLKPETLLASAVEQVAYTLENLNVKIVMKIDFHYTEVIRALKQTKLNSRVIFFNLYFL